MGEALFILRLFILFIVEGFFPLNSSVSLPSVGNHLQVEVFFVRNNRSNIRSVKKGSKLMKTNRIKQTQAKQQQQQQDKKQTIETSLKAVTSVQILTHNNEI